MLLPAVKSAKYCRPFAAEVKEIQAAHPTAKSLPLARKQIDTICDDAMYREWRCLATPKARAVKPLLERPSYISLDPKPAVSIRARLRLSCALTPKRRFVYGLVDHDRCDCGLVGDTDHVLLRCVKFASERLVCSTHLLSLSVPVVLSRDVILGLPPPLPLDRTLSKADIKLLHEQCLYFSGKFLEAIDRRFKL